MHHDAKSFAKAVRPSKDPDTGVEAREGFDKTRPTVHAFSLRLSFKDGRRAQGMPWFKFDSYEWSDDGTEELLSLIFDGRVIDVRGQQLWRLVEEMDEGHLRTIQEHDSKEIELLRVGNRSAKEGHEKPIIHIIDVNPPFAEAVREIRGSDDEPRIRAAGEKRGR